MNNSQGRKRPHFVRVRSAIMPMSGSSNASKQRATSMIMLMTAGVKPTMSV